MAAISLVLVLSVLVSNTHALLSNIASAAIGVGHTCAVNSSGSAFCWGYNYYGQIGDNGTVFTYSSTAYAYAPVQVVSPLHVFFCRVL